MATTRACTAAAILLVASSASGGGWPPDHAKANIDGRQAVAVFPVIAGGEPFASDDCVVQLAPHDAPHRRLTYRCGEWFVPPAPGGYRVWLELDGRVSSFQTSLQEPDEAPPYRGRGFVQVQDVVPSGFVSTASDVPPGHTVRYLNLDRPGRGFSLRASGSAAAKPAPMPPGRVVAGIFDDTRDEAVAYSRPLLVEEGKSTLFHIDPPAAGSDIVVHLQKSLRSQRGDTSLRIQTPSGVRPPDVTYDSATWHVGVWYGLPSEKATLSVSSPGFATEPQQIALQPQRVTTVNLRRPSRQPE